MNLHSFVRMSLFCAGVLTVCNTSKAEEVATEPAQLVVDLNGDGRPETITRRRLGSDNEIGTFYQIVVRDSTDTVLWKSPEILDVSHPLAFGEWHFGISMPQFAADIDGDGKVELLVPAPQSDVSPTIFRVLQWTGNAFEPKHSRALTGKGQKGALFNWSESPSPSDYWVQRWLGLSPEGGWLVELASLPDDGEVRTATGVLTAKDQGFELLRWIQPPTSPAAARASDAASTIDVTYRARLSAEDHVNSSGAELKKVIDILRQDRANYHRNIHRDAEDKGDERFSSADAREKLAALPVNVLGGLQMEAVILHENPVVEVTIKAGRVQVEVVKAQSQSRP